MVVVLVKLKKKPHFLMTKTKHFHLNGAVFAMLPTTMSIWFVEAANVGVKKKKKKKAVPARANEKTDKV